MNQAAPHAATVGGSTSATDVPRAKPRVGPGWGFCLVLAFWLLFRPVALSAEEAPPNGPADSTVTEAEGVAEGAAAPTGKVRPPIRWYIVPNVGFDTDDGLGFGARFELQRKDPERLPYRFGLVVHGYATLRGYHHHRLYFDLPGLGPKRRGRATLKIAYRQWLNDGYWGLGNGTVREEAYVGEFEKDDPRRKRYRYNLIQPFVHLALRQGLRPPFAAFLTLRLQYTIVKTYDGSLLDAERPPGMAGGPSIEVGTGLIVDTRDNEAAPNAGTFSELAIRAAPDLTGKGGAYIAPFLSARAYHTLVPGRMDRPWTGRLVVAWRLMGEWLLGDPPFYEMTRWGGSVPLLGFGGYETLRGAPFGRYRAPGRLVANVEARIDVFQVRLFKQPLRVQVVPFVDVGAVWGAGPLVSEPPPRVPLHPTPGLGLHVVYAESFVGRVDFSVAPDAVRGADGVVRDEPYWGLYLMFDQCF